MNAPTCVMQKTYFSHILMSALSLALALPILWCCPLKTDAEESVASRILYINSYHRGYGWSDDIDDGLRKTLDASGRAIELSVEYLDARRFSDSGHFEFLAAALAAKYKHFPFSLIIVSDNIAFDFALQYREKLFPGLPIVFCGYNNLQPEELKDIDNVTGVNEQIDFAAGVEMALRIHPDTRNLVFLLSTQQNTHRRNARQIQEHVLPRFDERYNIVPLTNVTLEQFKQRIAELSGQSILFSPGGLIGETYTAEQSLRLVAEASPFPVYAFWGFQIDAGAVGGRILSGKGQGRAAAELVLRILDGEDADDIAPVMESPTEHVFDYTALQRFGVHEDSLPPDSRLLNRPSLVLDREEWEWLAQHPRIRLVAPSNIPPYSMDIDGRHEGILPDFFKHFSQAIGQTIEFELVPSSDPHSRAKTKGNYGYGSLLDIPRNRQHYLLSDPYVSTPLMVFSTRKKLSMIRQADDLRGKRVAVLVGSRAIFGYLDSIGGVDTIAANSPLEQMQLVLRGEADALVGYTTYSYLINKYLLTDLLPAFIAKGKMTVHIGVNPEHPMLHRILNKAIATFGEQARQKILAKWMQFARNEITAVELSDEEKGWLKTHPVIRLGVSSDAHPGLFREANGALRGILPDFYHLIGERLGIRFEFVDERGPKIFRRLETRAIDMAGPMNADTAGGLGLLGVEAPYNALVTAFVRKDRPIAVRRDEDLEGLRVAYPRDVALLSSYFEDRQDRIDSIAADSPLDAFSLLLEDEVDVMVGFNTDSNLLAERSLSEIEAVYVFREPHVTDVMGIRPDMPLLMSILSKAMQSISHEERTHILSRWAWLPESIEFANIFSAEERAWLQAHPVIRLASGSAWPPFETIDEQGHYQGIAADYMRLIEKRLGVRFEMSPRKPWDEIIEMVRKKELDLLSCAMETEQRKEIALFTSPYLSHPMVIITRKDVGYVDGLEGLQEKKVSVAKGYASFELIASKHPEIDLRLYSDAESAMLAVSRGEEFAYIGDIATMSHIARNRGITNIKVSGETPYRFDQALGVRRDWPELRTILQKTLDSIGDAERSAIFQKWIAVETEERIDYTLIRRILIGAAIVLALFIHWNRRLSREITMRKQTESALNIAKETAESANHAKSAFLANMSHELRTPLNGILGYAQILKHTPDVSDHQQQGLSIIEQSGQHLLTMINDILDLSKIEAGKIELSPTDFELSSFLCSVEKMIRIRAEEKALSFRLEQDEHLPSHLHGDEHRLRQVLLNLLGNAVKFTDKGGVTLRVNRDQAAGGREQGAASRRQEADGREQAAGSNVPPVSSQQPATDLLFEIEDSGVGIPPEQLENIFEPFQQVGDAARKVEGTGLGLAICRRLIRLMGGQLSVESHPGRGSVFRVAVSLPEAKRPDDSVSRRTRNIVGVKGEAPTLLIVDDNSENRRVLVDVLAPLGFKTLEASGGQAALAVAGNAHPRGMLTDIMMPDMDGLELIRRIRRAPGLQDVVVIASSARVYEEDRQRCFDAGSDDFLPKPIQFDTLFDLLQKHLHLEWDYETDEQGSFSSDTSSRVTQLSEAGRIEEWLLSIPPEQLHALKEAAICNDITLMEHRIEALRPEHPIFAELMGKLAYDFEYEKILDLLETRKDIRE